MQPKLHQEIEPDLRFGEAERDFQVSDGSIVQLETGKPVPYITDAVRNRIPDDPEVCGWFRTDDMREEVLQGRREDPVFGTPAEDVIQFVCCAQPECAHPVPLLADGEEADAASALLECANQIVREAHLDPGFDSRRVLE